MKYIDKLMFAYREEIINGIQLAKEVKDTLYMDENNSDIVEGRIRKKLINKYSPYPIIKTPEEIVIEKESREEILAFFSWIRNMIGDNDWQLITWYVVDKMTFKQIGEELGVSKQAVFDRFKKIKYKINGLTGYFPGHIETIRECLTPKQSELEARAPVSLGYPHEFLQRVSVGGHWGNKRNGAKIFISNKKCLLPEYFAKSFGDNKTICTLCEGGKKCSRLQEKNNY